MTFDTLEARRDEIITLRRRIHQWPELAFEEERTSALIVSRLEAAGLDVRRVDTGVIAIVRGAKPGPTVAWRADMDALPIDEPTELPFASNKRGVMHACGHDGHTAIGIVVAETAAAIRDRICGSLVFLFQPAEETFQGAKRLLSAGALDSVDVLFGLHLTTHLRAGRAAIGAGPMWASADFFDIDVIGNGAHGAYPRLGRSPISAASVLVSELESLSSPESDQPITVSIGRLSSGARGNVIPDRAILSGSLRACSQSARQQAKRSIKRIAANISDRLGVVIKVRFLSNACEPVCNDHSCATKVRQAALAVLPDDEVEEQTRPSMASDDIAFLLAQRPGCYFRVGIGGSGPVTPHHSPRFVMDEAGLYPAAKIAWSTLTQEVSPTTAPDEHRFTR